MANDNTQDLVVGVAALALAWVVFNSVARPTRSRDIPIKVISGRREVVVAANYHDEYTDDEHNKQLELYRRLSDEDKMWTDRCERRVDDMLRSLSHEDADRPLFTFFERKAFDIPVTHRPRPRE